ncbi:class I SAM-dependent methyltransferase [Legionella hackeliae]|uniref:Putative methyltransferase n=1 Tax=Legionella hackeliae TaxID=449 RepID=A0A0A8US86_LEGHA|nr:class I SAM-dependent methyltransferase [Legionella hackeliae]KTD13108.1 methyltransferase [Legionella hackeliae]CEK11583.1 Putative methyltransferase [Legionella hackeliae]STX48355.1 methyltransferase [Legionella hackeliae]
MPPQEWPANNYAIGSYIQASIADNYLKYLEIKPTDSVLDIGCGNGAFSLKILDKIPHGHFLGIDASESMLALAKQEFAVYPNAKLQQADVLTMPFTNQFDYIVSFWCLQWCAFAIEEAFLNIHRALKTGGKVFALFPSGDDPFITSYYRLQESGRFPCLNNFKPPVDYRYFQNLEHKIQVLPFKHLKFERLNHEILLPSLDIFRKFVNGIAFFQGQISHDDINTLNEALVNTYEKECKEKFSGEYWFNLSIHLIRAEK